MPAFTYNSITVESRGIFTTVKIPRKALIFSTFFPSEKAAQHTTNLSQPRDAPHPCTARTTAVQTNHAVAWEPRLCNVRYTVQQYLFELLSDDLGRFHHVTRKPVDLELRVLVL